VLERKREMEFETPSRTALLSVAEWRKLNTPCLVWKPGYTKEPETDHPRCRAGRESQRILRGSHCRDLPQEGQGQEVTQYGLFVAFGALRPRMVQVQCAHHGVELYLYAEESASTNSLLEKLARWKGMAFEGANLQPASYSYRTSFRH